MSQEIATAWKQTITDQYELLRSLPPEQREKGLALIRETTILAGRAGYEEIARDEIDAVESIKRYYGDDADRTVAFLRGLLAGALTLDDFDSWFIAEAEEATILVKRESEK